MAERRPIVLLESGLKGELPVGDTLPGASVPTPAAPGQILYSEDGVTYAWVCVLLNADGLLIVDDDGIFVVDG